MKKTNKPTALLDAMRIRPTAIQMAAILAIVAKSGKKVSEVVRRALSLGLPWANEPTLARRMRSMKKALLQIGTVANEVRIETATLRRLVNAIPKNQETTIDTQVRINNALSLVDHTGMRLFDTMESIKAVHAQLTKYEALTPQDCQEVCHYLDKVAAASSSTDRKRRIEELVHLFRTLGGI